MACIEWMRLVERYSAALKLFDQAVTSAGGLEGEDFERARQNAERRKMAARAIEGQMEEHEHQHGCTGRLLAKPEV
ncbi:MAG TPA: hypothetical protein VKX39_07420 [Bryobacteraceae bacterium]|nr:hypothetical protein [Bryobacteraceae bacterium]